MLMTSDWEDAVRRGDAVRVRSLIEGGAAIDSKDGHGQTGLMVASARGQTEVVRVLLEHSAALDVTAKYNLSALMLAVINGRGNIVEMLLRAGADRAIRGRGAPGFHDMTALDLAEGAGHAEIAALLHG